MPVGAGDGCVAAPAGDVFALVDAGLPFGAEGAVVGVVPAGGGGASAGVVVPCVVWAVARVGGDDVGAVCCGAASTWGHGVTT